MSATIWECHGCGSVELQSVAEPTDRCICCKAVQWHNTGRAPSWKMQRDRIAELEAIISRAGALASQGASHEMIRQTLAEAKATN